RISSDGRCPDCGTRVPGVWPGAGGQVRTGNDMAAYEGRMPRRVELRQGDKETKRQGEAETGLITLSPRLPVSLSSSKGDASMLTDEEKQHVTRAAMRFVRAHVEGGHATFPAELAELGSRVVGGAFVSLKRGKHLRSCCGTIGRPMPL